MVLLTKTMEQKPVGGSFFAHSFQRGRAFEGYVYHTRPREIEWDKRSKEWGPNKKRPKSPEPRKWTDHTVVEKHTTTYRNPGTDWSEYQHKTNKKLNAMNRSESQPAMKFHWTDNFKDPNFLIPGNNRTSYKIQWDFKGPDDLKEKPDLSKMEAKPAFYPKEQCYLSLPKALIWGVDPDHYDNPPGQFYKNEFGPFPAAKKELPKTVEKWRSQEGWNDPTIRHCHKITQKVIPKGELLLPP